MKLAEIHILNCKRLKHFEICNMKLAEIHILNCKRLKHLEICNMKLAEIHILNCKRLKHLEICNMKLAEIHILNCKRLKHLEICNMKLAEIHILNCKRMKHLEICNMKLAVIHISSTASLETIKADKVVLPESQANLFVNQVLQSTALTHLTMKNISLGEKIVRFDRWHSEEWPNIQFQLENVTMSQESYKCLCTLQTSSKFSENQVT